MIAAQLSGYGPIYSGKVRDLYAPAGGADSDLLLLVASDRISAFDYIRPSRTRARF